MDSEVVSGVLAFVGAGIGSALAYVATRNATTAERQARRREEWGRRFTVALAALTSTDVRARATGRALIVELMRSELATADDRAEAAAVLDAGATHTADGSLRLIVPTAELDRVDIVGENEGDDNTDPSGARS